MKLYLRIFNFFYPPLQIGDVVKVPGYKNKGTITVVFDDNRYRVKIPLSYYSTASITYNREQLKLIKL